MYSPSITIASPLGSVKRIANEAVPACSSLPLLSKVPIIESAMT
jgi:hypothetical protein